MKTSSSFLMTTLGATVLTFTALTAASPGQAGGQQPASGSPAEDPAHELFIQTCNRCHDAARITALRRTKTEWEEVINKMIERGATGSEEDFMTVFGYLRRHYGKVYINTAPTEELATSLGLTNKDADGRVLEHCLQEDRSSGETQESCTEKSHVPRAASLPVPRQPVYCLPAQQERRGGLQTL